MIFLIKVYTTLLFASKNTCKKNPKEDSTLVYHLKFLLWEFFGKQFDNFLTFSLHRVCVSVTAGRIFMSFCEYCSIKIKDLNFIKWDFLNCSCGLQGKKCQKSQSFLLNPCVLPSCVPKSQDPAVLSLACRPTHKPRFHVWSHCTVKKLFKKHNIHTFPILP